MHKIERIAIAGVPNCGKTSLFNSLTGSRQKVGNWPGVTVEKIEGQFPLRGTTIDLVDLPGTYNLSPDSEDQKVAERVIREGEYDLILNVVDATSLSRNLFLTMDLKERTNQIIVILNMVDVAEKEGIEIDIERLSKELDLPVIPVVAVNKEAVAKALKLVENTIEDLPEHDSHVSMVEVIDSVSKYASIDKINSRVILEKKEKNESITTKIDNIVMHRFAAIPIFLASMFITFWFAIGFGSVFIDFFDIIGGLVFIDFPAALLTTAGSPEWLLVMAGGIGAGAQTVATFVPVVFFMFFALAILENLGYMARVGVVADRIMRKIGLPGSAFIPMVVGFGCTVPAVMAARTLTSKRDRFMTIFMAPFMSCGARLPVYALFCAALFGAYSGFAVFMIYLIGLAMAILTGFFLKNTLFKGAPSHFVMDLPLYHAPQFGDIFKSAWLRMKHFVKKAGKIVVIAVFVLSVLNSVGIEDGTISFGNEDSQHSILAFGGKAIGPVFEPMGISRENWPASVALFTGLFAKEAIVGTLNSLYASMDMGPSAEKGEEEESGGLDIASSITEAFTSVGEGVVGLITSVDILGIGLIAEDQQAISEEIGADTAVYKHIVAHFTVFSAFAYLLFVLMYFPCLAVIGAARQEMGGFYAGVMAVYSTLLAWAVATLFYQIAEGHNALFILLSLLILTGIYGGLYAIGKREVIASNVVFAPPIRKSCCE
ncbi:MAG: ferrous iron transport protein B [Desulforhopalus sp.]